MAASSPPSASAFTDHSSFANLTEARVVHMALDLAVDFASRAVSGTAALTVTVPPPALGEPDRDSASFPRRLILDTRALAISGVALRLPGGGPDRPLDYRLAEEPHPVLGSALTIDLPGDAPAFGAGHWLAGKAGDEGALPPGAPSPSGPAAVVVVAFSTTAGSSALQWLAPEQTAGKKHPYLFSQCQVRGRGSRTGGLRPPDLFRGRA